LTNFWLNNGSSKFLRKSLKFNLLLSTNGHTPTLEVTIDQEAEVVEEVEVEEVVEVINDEKALLAAAVEDILEEMNTVAVATEKVDLEIEKEVNHDGINNLNKVTGTTEILQKKNKLKTGLNRNGIKTNQITTTNKTPKKKLYSVN
jgi:hypothetical protein